MSQRSKYANVRRKDSVPEEDRTEGKDDAAEIIQSLIDEGEWPVSLPDLADDTEWSRAHYQNTLRDYFEPVEESNQTEEDQRNEHREHIREMREIEIPEDVDIDSYLRGFIAGRQYQK